MEQANQQERLITVLHLDTLDYSEVFNTNSLYKALALAHHQKIGNNQFEVARTCAELSKKTDIELMKLYPYHHADHTIGLHDFAVFKQN